MKSKKIPLEQYSFFNKYLEGDNEELLDLISSHVGHLVFEFNLLEERLTTYIWDLISDRAHSKGILITHNMNYSSKIDLLNRYSEYTQHICGKKISIHSKLITDLKECGRLRNLVIHAEWNTVDLEGYAFVKFRLNKKDIIQEFVQFDEDSLIKIRNLIIDTHNAFDNYEEAYSELLRI